MKPNAKEMAAIVAARNKKTNRKKPKPATIGERSEMASRKMTLRQVRTFGDTRSRAEQIDRVVARNVSRAVKAERDRCSAIVLYVAARDQNRWIRNGWDPRKDDE